MKKTILILLLAGFATALYAGPITPEKALKVAEKVLSVQPVTKSASGLQIIWDGETAGTKADGQDPAFYVVGRDGGGFVIVAGNDNVRPVLALSYTNRFQVENMPCNVSAWMERIKRYSRTTKVATAEVRAQWDAFAETKAGEILPEAGITGKYFPGGKATVEWDQDAPGNLLLPIASGDTDHAASGCVAIAMAEIMTWFKYPASGNGTVSGYTSSIKGHTATIPEHTLGTVYDWDGMELLTDYQKFRAADDDLKNNIAQLIYDIGTILQLNYSTDATEGNATLVPTEMSEHMGYSRSVVKKSREWDYYPGWKWDQMLEEQVTDHPVFYSGTDPDNGAGHAYVVDGYALYSGERVFHFNFGWSGLCNGYYYSDYQAPEDDRVTDEGFGSYYSVEALIDFVPDSGGTSQYVTGIKFFPYDATSGFRAELINDVGIDYTFYHATVKGMTPVTVDLGVFKLDRDGNVSGDAIQEYPGFTCEPDFYKGFSWGFNFTSPGVFGDKFAMFYKEGDSDYQKIEFDNPSLGPCEIPIYPAAFIKTEASYSTGDYFYFRLTNHNYSYADAAWIITDPSGNTTKWVQREDRFQLTKSGKYTIKVTPYEGAETIVVVINVN
ncbi:MAG: C10 family peptidase [Bacteroidales bacterium]|nr:C10 family peptidase [Bacteroidales bacterium]